MRKVLLLCLFFSCFCFSQNKQILYGFGELPQTLLLNPGAKVNNDWYFGVPFLSHIHANFGSSKVTVYDLFVDDNTDFNDKLRSAIYSMQPNDFVTFNQQLEIVSGGFAYGDVYEKNKYISFGLYQELDFIGYFPKDYAILAYEGNFNNTNRLFRADHLKFSAEMISVLHVGFNKKVNNKFTYGFRGKIYSSIINVNSLNNKGGLVTVPGDNNLLRHEFNLDGGVRSSGLAPFLENNSDADASTLQKSLLFGGNLGLGLDVGITYQINDQWYIDASLLDIGFISHKKDIENYEINGDYVFEGVDPLFPDSSGRTADTYWSEIEDDFEALFTTDTTRTKFTTIRPIKLNASLNYSFGRKQIKECNCTQDQGGYLNTVGGQLYAINRPKGAQLALTAYYYRSLFKGLDAKVTYTIDSYSFNNIGFGVSANIAGINIYAMADNFLNFKNIYNAQSVSLQLGINYILNKNEN